MKAVLAAFAACTLACVPYAGHTQSAKTRPADIPMHRIEQLVRNSMAKAYIPGAAVAIVKQGKIVYLRAFGEASIEWPNPVTTDTVFQIASATKGYTAALLLRFVDKGLIALDDPVAKHIPDALPAWQRITIRHLAQHTAGLPSQEPDPALIETAEAAGRALASGFRTKPGEVSRYGSWDFTILQHILEKVGGKPFPLLIQDELFLPLGMNSTRFEQARDYGTERIADAIPHRAENYVWNGRVNQRSWYLYPPYTYAAGGAYSSIRDVARFVRAIDDGRFLSAASRQALWTPSRLLNGSAGEFGVGWTTGTYRGRRYGGHSGGPALADMLYFPDERLGIAVLTNQKTLTPVLALLIADAMLPAPDGYYDGGTADANPQLTRVARTLVEQMQRGAVEPRLVQNDDVQQAQNLSSWGGGWLALYPPLSKVMLLSDELGEGGSHFRRYRFVFDDHVQTIGIQTNAAGRVMGLAPEGDDAG